MARFLLLAINSPTEGEGDDAAFNRWYDGKHASDMLSIDGAKSVRRFRILQKNRVDQRYVALTEFEGDDPAAILQQLGAKASDFEGSHVDRDTSIFVLAEELTPGA